MVCARPSAAISEKLNGRCTPSAVRPQQAIRRSNGRFSHPMSSGSPACCTMPRISAMVSCPSARSTDYTGSKRLDDSTCSRWQGLIGSSVLIVPDQPLNCIDAEAVDATLQPDAQGRMHRCAQPHAPVGVRLLAQETAQAVLLVASSNSSALPPKCAEPGIGWTAIRCRTRYRSGRLESLRELRLARNQGCCSEVPFGAKTRIGRRSPACAAATRRSTSRTVPLFDRCTS